MTRRFVHILCSFTLAGQMALPAFAAGQPDLNFKVYSPDSQTSAEPSKDSTWSPEAEKPAADPAAANDTTPVPPTTTATTEASTTPMSDASATPTSDTSTSTSADGASGDGNKDKVLQGYIRVVPSGTKIPIIMDTAVDSDTSQEGDEFSARSSEDLNIDGQTVVPAGSVIKGRIAQLNAPRSMGRSGSVALKFDTVTTPDNRQIPLVANLVARGGVVHARRGVKDIAIAGATLVIPTALGIGIGALAGSSTSSSSTGSSSKISKGTAAMIGAGVGVAIGVAILLIKKGKKIDVRPGDELKIELAEDLRMPM